MSVAVPKAGTIVRATKPGDPHRGVCLYCGRTVVAYPEGSWRHAVAGMPMFCPKGT